MSDDETQDWQHLSLAEALNHSFWQRFGIPFRLVPLGTTDGKGAGAARRWAVTDGRNLEGQSTVLLSREDTKTLIAVLAHYYHNTSDAAIAQFNARYGPKPALPAMPTQSTLRPLTSRRHSTDGSVYLLDSHLGYYKIGWARDVGGRIRAVELQLPFPVTVAHTITSNNPRWAESQLHKRFAAKRTNGEWFALDADDVAYIQSLQRLDREAGND